MPVRRFLLLALLVCLVTGNYRETRKMLLLK